MPTHWPDSTVAWDSPRRPCPLEADRADALLRSVAEIEGVLDDLDRRNLDLRQELRTLRNQIADLFKRRSPSERRATKRRDRRHGRRHRRNRTRDRPISKRHLSWSFAPHGAIESSFTTAVHGQDELILQLPVPQGARHQITPIWNRRLPILALNVSGPNVSRIAVYAVTSKTGGAWYSQELREPVDDARASVSLGAAAYALGRYVYAFSYSAKRWDILELPPGASRSVGLR